MTLTYKEFLKHPISLEALGILPDPSPEKYPCTPKKARIFGRAGVDGIHYCQIGGCGEWVFSVSPDDGYDNALRPLARNFEDFLRLLLACGTPDAAEQQWIMTEAEFDRYLAENPVTPEQKKILDQIQQTFSLTPMESPYQYLTDIWDEIDLSGIERIAPPHYAQPEPPKKWEVYFEEFHSHPNSKPGTEIPLDVSFQWENTCWVVPAVYFCGKGLVVELARKIDPEIIRNWSEQLQNDALSEEEREALENQSPFDLNLRAEAICNEKPLSDSGSIGMNWNPCDSEEAMYGNSDARQFLKHYGLDLNSGWSITRISMPWEKSRPRSLRSFYLTLTLSPLPVCGPHWTDLKAGDCREFLHPLSGERCTFTAEALEAQKSEIAPDPNFEFPTHHTVLTYSVAPKLPPRSFYVTDAVRGDSPRPKENSGGSACFIGMAVRTDPGVQAVSSSLHFEENYPVDWTLYFQPESRSRTFLLK